MVRGRKPDPNAPLSRSLLSQRDYRARKAQYVSDLEQKCKQLEEENERLTREVESLRQELGGTSRDDSSLPSHLTSEGALVDRAHALTGVLNHLQIAITSIQNFQQATLGPHFNPQSHHRYEPIRVASLNSASSDSSSSSPQQALSSTSSSTPSSHHGPFPGSRSISTDDWDPNSPGCCGGILDCRGLTDDSSARRGGIDGKGKDKERQPSSEYGNGNEGETTPTLENPTGPLLVHSAGVQDHGPSVTSVGSGSRLPPPSMMLRQDFRHSSADLQYPNPREDSRRREETGRQSHSL
ncbi:hypothetical protein K435DRAFT_864127 [Dendrothele bispora CBS 962.96]|uniref:BZIP domain-containing protein n=1 Tax=Dendrothele bispora (strain CBS 962.96) TaxID=1314807 RepID=A0A4S8LMS2_DENBC|nr:hypothetical protein K435DRAFT_864127 [Dendrothele bispora CBS 962.96]